MQEDRINKDSVFKKLSRFRLPRNRKRLLFLLIPVFIVLVEFFVLGLTRRSFVFYSMDDNLVAVENRLLKKSNSREVNITRYVEDALLGPFSRNSLPLFPKETRLLSLLYRDGVVFADFSQEAVLPPLEGGEVFRNFNTLYSGIKRNFPFVRDIRFFISGKVAYPDEFDQESGLEIEAVSFLEKDEI